MSKLTKSLSELDAIADELLAKSQQDEEVIDDTKEPEESEAPAAPEESEELEKSEKASEEELKPEDVSENVPEEEVENAEESEESEESEEKEESEESEEQPEEKEKPEKSEKPEEPEEKEELEKSIKSTFEDNEDIKKSMDASVFLSAVTEVLAKSLADVVYNMQGTSQLSSESNEVLAKSLQASLNLNKAMSAELYAVKSQNEELKKSIQDGFTDIRDYISEQFDQFSHQPASLRKSVDSVSVHDRNFNKSLAGQTGVESLSKSEVLAKLNTLMYSGNPLVQPTDIISYESGAPLRPEVANLVMSNM